MVVEGSSYVSKAREHIEMAVRLRARAVKLRTRQAQAKMTQLANLYEQLSLCYLEESCVAPLDSGRGDARKSMLIESVTVPQCELLEVAGTAPDNRHQRH